MSTLIESPVKHQYNDLVCGNRASLPNWCSTRVAQKELDRLSFFLLALFLGCTPGFDMLSFCGCNCDSVVAVVATEAIGRRSRVGDEEEIRQAASTEVSECRVLVLRQCQAGKKDAVSVWAEQRSCRVEPRSVPDFRNKHEKTRPIQRKTQSCQLRPYRTRRKRRDKR